MRGTFDELCGNSIGPSTDLCQRLQAGQIEGIFSNCKKGKVDFKNNLHRRICS
jgi:hypothetical protein